MKFCTTCGEVYPSSAEMCTADNSFLESWTQVPKEADQIEEGLDDDDSSDEHTAVELVPSPGPRGKKGTDSTKSIDITDPVTLAEFDAGSGQTGEHTGLRMVVYDDEEDSTFVGMLVGDRYRLDKLIGTGGFGVVYDAFDIETDNRVAIKILSPTMSANRRTLTRFRREALAASRIKHPGIIKVEDFGIADDGVSYIVMEYLDGQDLAAIIAKEGAMDPLRALNIIMQCAHALAAAHREGVWHRDLKPANIFLTASPQGTDSIKILDFGIAKDRNSNPRTANLTSASKVVGTPYYMSPEQARGTELDGRADLYSLGIILYELLTGLRPFQGNSPYEILVAHARAPRVAPSKHRKELKDQPMLDDVVLKSIAAAAEKRFASMEQFAEALANRLGAAALSGDMVANPFQVSTELVQHEASRPSQLVRSRKRFPLWFLAAAPVAVAAVLFIFRGSDASETKPQPAALVAPEQQTKKEVKAEPLDAPDRAVTPPSPTAAAITPATAITPTEEPEAESESPGSSTMAVSKPVAKSKRRGKRRGKRRAKTKAKRNAGIGTEGISEW